MVQEMDRKSRLAVLAEICSPAGQDHAADRFAALVTRLSLPTVYLQLQLKITGLPIVVHKIDDGGAPPGNSLLKHISAALRYSLPCLPMKIRGRNGRRDPCLEENLIGIDVADADHHPAVHQKILNGLSSRSCLFEQVERSEIVSQRFAAETGKKICFLGIAGSYYLYRTKAPCIIETEFHAVIKLHPDMIVPGPFGLNRKQTEPASHAEVDRHGCAVFHAHQ